MEIQAEKFKIEMTYNELQDAAFNVRNNLIHALKNHWVKHQSNWMHNEIERLNICKNMFFALGRPELYEEIFKYEKEIFDAYNNEKRISDENK